MTISAPSIKRPNPIIARKISINNLTAFQTGWSNSSGYGISSYQGRFYLKPSDLGTAAAVDPSADVLIIEDADDSSTVAKKTGISDLIANIETNERITEAITKKS